MALAMAACAPEPLPAAAAVPAPPPVVDVPAPPPVAATTTAATSTPPEAPGPSKRPSVAEILATVPDRGGVIKLDKGPTITITEDGEVTVDYPTSELGATSACGANGFEYKKSVALFAELQSALADNAREKVAALVLYPLRVNLGPRSHRLIKDAAALGRDFDVAFPPPVVKKVLDAEPRAIFCRADGFMLGSGVVWAEVQKGRYGVVVVNR